MYMHDVWHSYVNVGGEAVYSNYISINCSSILSKVMQAWVHGGWGSGFVYGKHPYTLI